MLAVKITRCVTLKWLATATKSSTRLLFDSFKDFALLGIIT